jgi:DNA-binding MarR family transcriptional regulator
MQSKLQGVFFDRAYVDLVDGDIPAALMFSQIAYWYGWGEKGKSKLRVFHDGTYWLAKSAPDWNAELGLTEKQAYRCIGVLKAKGLIQTKVMKFNSSPTVHIRLTPAGEEALKCHSESNHLASKEDAFALGGKSLTESTANNTAQNTTDSADKPAETMKTQEQLGKDSKEENKQKKENKKKEKKYENELGKLWRQQMSIKYPGYQKVLTKKEYGQLKQFKDKAGSKAEDAVNFAIQDWLGFAFQAKRDKGASSLPEKPVVGFLLKYYDVLFQLMEKTALKKLQAAAYELSILGQSNYEVSAPKEEPAIHTPESIAADLAYFKKN